jgi:hypothetical protein
MEGILGGGVLLCLSDSTRASFSLHRIVQKRVCKTTTYLVLLSDSLWLEPCSTATEEECKAIHARPSLNIFHHFTSDIDDSDMHILCILHIKYVLSSILDLVKSTIHKSTV